MHDDRHTLLYGPYKTPFCPIGRKLRCRLRGRRVSVIVIADTPIPWPQASRGRRNPILCGDLIRAVKRESASAICYWWGVTPQTVSKWRKLLGVPKQTPGTVNLQARTIGEHFDEDARRRAREATQRPERNAKIAEARRGQPRPEHVREALRRANLGRKLPRRTRKKMNEAGKRRAKEHPHPFAWTPEEDALLGTMMDKDVAAQIGRNAKAVFKRRVKLGIAAYRSP